MAKKAGGQKVVTKTSPTTKTVTIRDKAATKATPPPARATRTGPPRAARSAVVRPVAPVQPVQPAAPAPEAPKADEPRPAGVTHHVDHQATLDQLNGQLGAIRGLPQYADLEKELTERIAALSASHVKA